MEKPIEVAVAGHFNPLHGGHLRLFEVAKELGDTLTVIVANDTQAAMKREPVFISCKDRMNIIKHLKEVDKVVESIDETSDISQTLSIVRPDIFASGCDENHPDAVEERKICEKLGIKTVYNVGGDKIESSSQLLNNYKNHEKNNL